MHQLRYSEYTVYILLYIKSLRGINAAVFWYYSKELHKNSTQTKQGSRHSRVHILHTVNPQKRPAGLILSLRVQMRVLLEFGQIFYIFAYCFLSFLRVLLECGSYSRAGLFRGFTVVHFLTPH